MPGFTIDEEDNVVEFDAEFQFQLTINVKVPVNTSLKLSSANAGEMTVEGVNGTHELENANGGISCRSCSYSALDQLSWVPWLQRSGQTEGCHSPNMGR